MFCVASGLITFLLLVSNTSPQASVLQARPFLFHSTDHFQYQFTCGYWKLGTEKGLMWEGSPQVYSVQVQLVSQAPDPFSYVSEVKGSKTGNKFRLVSNFTELHTLL